jgi:cytochrome oxidase Cu insertion factor (SCO1/SenC/PrrC family)
LPALALTSSQQDVIATQNLLGKWLLVWTPPAECGANCVAGVARLTQLYLAVGKDGPRLRRVVIGSGEPSVWHKLDQEHAGTVFVTGPETSVQRLLQTLQGTVDRQEAYYFIDPAGTIVLRYAAGANPKGMLKDLERLLKYSWLG